MVNVGSRSNETWVAATTAVDVAAFTAMTGEVVGGAGVAGRIARVTGIHYSCVAASSFAVQWQFTDPAGVVTTGVVYPPSGGNCNVAAGGVIDTEIVTVNPIPAGAIFLWRSPSGGATAREVAIRIHDVATS